MMTLGSSLNFHPKKYMNILINYILTIKTVKAHLTRNFAAPYSKTPEVFVTDRLLKHERTIDK
jgi:hypothetical protein